MDVKRTRRSGRCADVSLPERLARVSARHPWRTVAVWIVVLVTAGLCSQAFLAGALTTQSSFTNKPDSVRAQDLIEQRLTGPAKDTELVIVRSRELTAASPRFAGFVTGLRSAILGLGPAVVLSAPDYLTSAAPGLVSGDRHATLIPVTFARNLDNATAHIARLDAITSARQQPPFEVLIAGNAQTQRDFTLVAESDMRKAETIGTVIALLVLLAVFGALVAALLPLGLGAVAIVLALGAIGLLGLRFHFTFTVTNMVSMMGLAVAIDYSLFIVSRYREERRSGREKISAIEATSATASRAVLFSGLTVVLALLGMLIIPNSTFRSLGSGAILVVLAAVAAALTLLPALLALLGDRVERGRVFRHKQAQPAGSVRLWARLAAAVMRRPVLSLTAGAGVLVLIALSLFGMHVGASGVSSLPAGSESRRAFTVLSDEFAGGLAAPVQIVVAGRVATPAVLADITRLRGMLVRTPGLAPLSTLTTNRAGNLALISVPVTGDPNGPAAVAAISKIRDDLVPRAFGHAPAQVLVGGQTALNKDFFDLTVHYRPPVFLFVLGLSFLLLLMVFRSVVVPATAIIMNLLSVAAAYGMLVLVFQSGGPPVGRWIAAVFGFHQVPTIEAWLPLFLFSVLFGLSMDYNVFLLSRIRERFLQTRDNAGSVAFGLSHTGGIITGAALIMVAVFGGVALGNLVMMQQMGFGLAVAVLLDATVVRCLLVPATMKLLGDWNWYLPRWLSWLPNLSVETRPPQPGGPAGRQHVLTH
jgi:putative drug exporter of the RND superfamily